MKLHPYPPFTGLFLLSLAWVLSSFVFAPDCIINKQEHPVTRNLCLATQPNQIKEANIKFYYDYAEAQYWLEGQVLTNNDYRRTIAGNKAEFAFTDGTTFTLTNHENLEPRVDVTNLVYAKVKLHFFRFRGKIDKVNLESLRDKELLSIVYQVGEAPPPFVQSGNRKGDRQYKKFVRKSKVTIGSFKTQHRQKLQNLARCMLAAQPAT